MPAQPDQKRLATGYLDRASQNLDEALEIIEQACAKEKPSPSASSATQPRSFELVQRGVRPDVVTDQTSAHDPLHGYLPAGWSRRLGAAARR